MTEHRGALSGNVARHRIIDDILRSALQRNDALKVVILGAGLDTRAFRLRGGRWWEFDAPALMAFKERRLPANTAPNPLTRIGIDFVNANLCDQLAPLAGSEEVCVVMEGVCVYLPEEEITRTAAAIREVFPHASIVCDLMSPAFQKRFSSGLSKALGRIGAHFAPHSRHPRAAIEAAGYRAKESISIVGRAREAGTVRIPRWLFNSLLRELRDGYAVFTFEPESR